MQLMQRSGWMKQESCQTGGTVGVNHCASYCVVGLSRAKNEDREILVVVSGGLISVN